MSRDRERIPWKYIIILYIYYIWRYGVPWHKVLNAVVAEQSIHKLKNQRRRIDSLWLWVSRQSARRTDLFQYIYYIFIIFITYFLYIIYILIIYLLYIIYIFIIYLAPWAGKMNRISRCDWLPERARWSYLARSGYGLCPARTKIMLGCFSPYNKSYIDQACSVKMAGYWPRSFF